MGGVRVIHVHIRTESPHQLLHSSVLTTSQSTSAAAITNILREKDVVIEQLHAALASLKRQVAVLKGAIVQEGGSAKNEEFLRAQLDDSLAQAAMHEQSYKQVRRDYHSLLNKCARLAFLLSH